MDFKVRAIAQRLQIEYAAAEKMVIKQQKQRDAFTRDFLIRMIITRSVRVAVQ